MRRAVFGSVRRNLHNMGTQQFTPQQVIDAIRQGHTPTGAAHFLKCDPDTIRRYAKRYATVNAELLEHRKQIVDLAETGLRGAVLRSEPWAIAFSLKTLAPEVYNPPQRSEISGPGGKPIETRQTHDVEPGFFADIFVILGSVNATPGTQETDQSAQTAGA